MERTPAQRIVDDHVKCNVTLLIANLADLGDEDARHILYGNGDDEDASYEVWAVSEWLALQLEQLGHRVPCYGANQHYWARGATGQAIYMDDVIETIAKTAFPQREPPARINVQEVRLTIAFDPNVMQDPIHLDWKQRLGRDGWLVSADKGAERIATRVDTKRITSARSER